MPLLPCNVSGWIALATFHVGSVVVMAGVLASAPDPSGEIALVFSPRASAAEAIDRAAATGARLVRVGAAPWIVVVAPDPQDRDFSANARAHGAWLLLNPVVARGCAARRARVRSV